MRFCPWIVAMPVVSVSGVSQVEVSEKPTHHVGSAAATASRSSRSSRSMPVSPPHGGTIARIAGSSSIVMSSAARSSRGPLMCEGEWREVWLSSPTTTSKPLSRKDSTAYVKRGQRSSATPELGEVTPIAVAGAQGCGVADRHDCHCASHADPAPLHCPRSVRPWRR